LLVVEILYIKYLSRILIVLDKDLNNTPLANFLGPAYKIKRTNYSVQILLQANLDNKIQSPVSKTVLESPKAATKLEMPLAKTVLAS
jgi:hypothetical protein